MHDVQWSASGDHFVTVSGYMPAKANLFNAKCKMLHELCTGPYNLIRWNPQVKLPSLTSEKKKKTRLVWEQEDIRDL